MPKVHFVKKARKDNSAVKAGESYYWWKFRYGPKICSATLPKRSQLTRSAFFSQLWEIEDRIAELTPDTIEDFEGIKEDVAQLLEETEENLDMIPQQLQETHMLYERVYDFQDFYSELDHINIENAETEEAKQELIDEIQSIEYSGG